MLNRRGRIDIIYSVVKTIRKYNPWALVTTILYKSNLSYTLLKKYLNYLLEKELISKKTIKKKKSVYAITERGEEFLRAYEELRTVLEGRESYMKTSHMQPVRAGYRGRNSS